VRRRAAQLGLDLKVGGRCDDDLADRRRVVEDVAEVAAQRAAVEMRCAAQPVLLADGEQQLDAGPAADPSCVAAGERPARP